MNNSDNELSYNIIRILGEENINEIYSLTGSKRISFAHLKQLLLREKTLEFLRENNSIKRTAEKLKISRMTIYRILKSKIKK